MNSKVLTKKQLNSALAKLAKYNRLAIAQRDLIYAHCVAVYGVDPSEIDNDTYIDFDNGCGISSAMTADELNSSMLECIDRRKKY